MNDTDRQQKTCIDCHEVKPVDAFYPLRRNGKVYRQSRCKGCNTRNVAARKPNGGPTQEWKAVRTWQRELTPEQRRARVDFYRDLEIMEDWARMGFQSWNLDEDNHIPERLY